MKKKLFLAGKAALLCALVLAFAGCERPATTVIPKMQVSIAIDSETDDHLDLATSAENDLSRAAKDTIQLTANGESVRWFIDANELPGTDGFISIAAIDYPIGLHYVTAIVWKDGIPYSKGLTFKVVE